MEDVNPVQPGVTAEAPAANPQMEIEPTETESVDATPSRKGPPPTVPYERFRDVNQKYRNLEAEVEKLRANVAAPRTPTVDQNDVEVIKTLAKQAGFVTREEVLNEQFDEAVEAFTRKHEEFYGYTQEGDSNWQLLSSKFKDFQPPKTLAKMHQLLEESHKLLFGDRDEEKIVDKAKKEVYAQQVTTRRASMGGGVSAKAPTPQGLDPSVQSRLSGNDALRKKQLEILESLGD